MTSPEGSKAGEERGQFCWCPPGKFKMGPTPWPPWPPAEMPAVSVTLSHGFRMGKYLVTQAQYQLVMGTNPSGFLGVALPVDGGFTAH